MIRCAALQLVSGPSLAGNLARVEALAQKAAGADVKLLVLPENFALFGNKSGIAELARREADTGELQSRLSAMARDLKLTLIGGTIPVASDDGRSWASCFSFGPDGESLGCYRKIHLFDASVDDATGSYRESDDYRPGEDVCVLDTALGRVGVAICYDLRFPALFQQMLSVGVDIIVVPSAFTRATGQAHWLPLLRARAIECQSLVVGANQGGEHAGGRQTSGGSVIIDAWGRVLAEAGFGEGLVIAEWNTQEQGEIRQRMPVVEHRRRFDE